MRVKAMRAKAMKVKATKAKAMKAKATRVKATKVKAKEKAITMKKAKVKAGREKAMAKENREVWVGISTKMIKTCTVPVTKVARARTRQSHLLAERFVASAPQPPQKLRLRSALCEFGWLEVHTSQCCSSVVELRRHDLLLLSEF